MERHRAWTCLCRQGFHHPLPYHFCPPLPLSPLPPSLPPQQQHQSCCFQQQLFHPYYCSHHETLSSPLPTVCTTTSSAEQNRILEDKVTRLEANLSTTIAKLDEAVQSNVTMDELINVNAHNHISLASDDGDKLDLTKESWPRSNVALDRLNSHKQNAAWASHSLKPGEGMQPSQVTPETVPEPSKRYKHDDLIRPRHLAQYKTLFSDEVDTAATCDDDMRVQTGAVGVTAERSGTILNDDDLIQFDMPEYYVPSETLFPNGCVAHSVSMEQNASYGNDEGKLPMGKKSILASAPNPFTKQQIGQPQLLPQIDHLGPVPEPDLARDFGATQHRDERKDLRRQWLIEPGFSNMPTSIRTKTEDPCYDPARDDGSKNFKRGVLVTNLSPQTCIEELDALAASHGAILSTKLIPTMKSKIRTADGYRLLETMTAYIIFESDAAAEQFVFDALQEDQSDNFTVRGYEIKATHIDTPTFPAGVKPWGPSTHSWGLISRYVKFEQPNDMDAQQFEERLLSCSYGLDQFDWILRRETRIDKSRGRFVYMEFASVQIADYVVKLVNDSPSMKKCWKTARLVKEIPPLSKKLLGTSKDDTWSKSTWQGDGQETVLKDGKIEKQDEGQEKQKRKLFTNRLSRYYTKANFYDQDALYSDGVANYDDYDGEIRELSERSRLGRAVPEVDCAPLYYGENVIDYGTDTGKCSQTNSD